MSDLVKRIMDDAISHARVDAELGRERAITIVEGVLAAPQKRRSWYMHRESDYLDQLYSNCMHTASCADCLAAGRAPPSAEEFIEDARFIAEREALANVLTVAVASTAFRYMGERDAARYGRFVLDRSHQLARGEGGFLEQVLGETVDRSSFDTLRKLPQETLLRLATKVIEVARQGADQYDNDMEEQARTRLVEFLNGPPS